MLISLIGEQPIPNLLPIRYLKPAENLLVYTAKTEQVAQRLRRIISGRPDLAADLPAEPYDFDGLRQKLAARLDGKQDVLFNLTGGTKMMALAAFSLAVQFGFPFVYMENQGSTLRRYSFVAGAPVLQETTNLQTLISTSDYLNAHLDGFKQTGFHKDVHGKLDSGGLFEQVVFQAIENGLGKGAVLAGIRPTGEGLEQIDIDLAFRVENHVGIAEVKLGNGEGPKKGLDQLKMAGEADFLGTYTAQFLITGTDGLNKSLKTLATKRKIKVISLRYNEKNHSLPSYEAERLVAEIRKHLAA